MEDLNGITLPDKIFFCGAPGSKWSGVAQEIKKNLSLNMTDRAPHRVYKHSKYSGHLEAYYGTGMEFSTDLNEDNLYAPYTDKSGSKLLMSHEWCYHFDDIIKAYPNSCMILVYRPSWESFLWWKAAGGFKITYPNYDWYVDDETMCERIEEQNKLILEFAQKNKLLWKQHDTHRDVFITTCLNYY